MRNSSRWRGIVVILPLVQSGFNALSACLRTVRLVFSVSPRQQLGVDADPTAGG